MTTVKLPFLCTIYDTEPVFVKNPFSGEGCLLSPEAVAVYDTIKGCELVTTLRFAKVSIGLSNTSLMNI
jgi:hypothetical protein